VCLLDVLILILLLYKSIKKKGGATNLFIYLFVVYKAVDMTQTEAFSEEELNVLVGLARPFFSSKSNNMIFSVEHGQNDRNDPYDMGAFTGERPRGIEYQTVLPNSVIYKTPSQITQLEMNDLIRAFGFLHVFDMLPHTRETKVLEPFLEQTANKERLLEDFFPKSEIKISELTTAIENDFLQLSNNNPVLPHDITGLKKIQKDCDDFILLCFLLLGCFELFQMGRYEEWREQITPLMNQEQSILEKIRFLINKRQQCLQKIREITEQRSKQVYSWGGRKKTNRSGTRQRRRIRRKRTRRH
jgi:hypothetical protein